MKRIVKEAVIERKLTDEEKDIIRSHLECNYKIVMLYPINENTEVPKMHYPLRYGIFLKVIMLLRLEIWINFQISLFILIFSE